MIREQDIQKINLNGIVALITLYNAPKNRAEIAQQLKQRHNDSFDIYNLSSTLLLTAIQMDLAFAQYLIENDADVNFCGFYPVSPLKLVEEMLSLPINKNNVELQNFKDLLITKNAESFNTQFPKFPDKLKLFIHPKKLNDGTYSVNNLAKLSVEILNNIGDKLTLSTDILDLQTSLREYNEEIRTEYAASNNRKILAISPKPTERKTPKPTKENSSSMWVCWFPMFKCCLSKQPSYQKLSSEDVELTQYNNNFTTPK